ncbi:hypothetical protein WJX74_010068 [Apatococcus lobatus]|uniref:Uncharacterized protein n=1 Tax=Apatococcus lobatus TaxID=904363 RepID=A0AAW1S4G7_9CHLO
MFQGLSSLRANEAKAPAKQTEQAKALAAYLEKYQAGEKVKEGPAKKKRKKTKAAIPVNGIRIVDQDTSGFAVTATADEDEEDEPVIANPIEAAKAQEQAELERLGLATSGWREAKLHGNALSDHLDDSGIGIMSAKRQRHDSPDLSPSRRQRHDSPDLPPPRRQQHDAPGPSPPRRQRHDSPDLSPPRRQRHDSPDVSPPRRQRHDSPDLSPPRRQRHDSPDLSPPRRPTSDAAADEDLSPPRKRARGSPEVPASRGAQPAIQSGQAARMTDGTRTGMVSGRDVAAEMALKRSQEAARVYRDKSGKKYASKEEFEKSRDADREKKKVQRVTPEWGTGLAQQKAAQEAAEAMRQQAAQPFARTREDLDSQLKDRTRFGDPMAHLVKKRQAEPPAPVIPEHVQQQMAKSGFVIPQAVPGHSWLKRNLGPPLNRYNIRPGRHWDGVDRSNGFEKEMFKQQNERASRDAQAMMWSQEDM